MKRCVVVVALTLAACGVPTQDAFDQTKDSAFDVDPPRVTEHVDTTETGQAVLPVSPHYVAEAGIVRAPEALESYESILDALQTRPEDGTGLRTAVSPDTVLAIRADGSAAVVDLSELFQTLPPEEQRLAAAQIVLTLTDRVPNVRVRFALNGEAVDVPTADNTVSLGGSLGRSDYLSLLAQSSDP